MTTGRESAYHSRCPHGTGNERCVTTISDLNIYYGNLAAVKNASFTFACGDITALIGPNGGGKSSILKAILGLNPSQGSIDFHRPGGAKPRIGYVPQRTDILSDSPLSVCDLLLVRQGYRPAWFHVPHKQKSAMRDLLAIVNAADLLDRRISELSGGELQRVLLASSLSPLPDILLLDEPVSAFDVKGIELFYEIICSLRHRYHMSILVVTHDINAIIPHTDSMVLVNNTVLTQGRPADVVTHESFQQLMGFYTPNPKLKSCREQKDA